MHRSCSRLHKEEMPKEKGHRHRLTGSSQPIPLHCAAGCPPQLSARQTPSFSMPSENPSYQHPPWPAPRTPPVRTQADSTSEHQRQTFRPNTVHQAQVPHSPSRQENQPYTHRQNTCQPIGGKKPSHGQELSSAERQASLSRCRTSPRGHAASGQPGIPSLQPHQEQADKPARHHRLRQ